MKKAFTMIEVIFVVVIIGILSVVAVWSMPRTELQQATEYLINSLKYTRTLAQTDDRYFAMSDKDENSLSATEKAKAESQVKLWNDSKKWESKKGLWQLQFHQADKNATCEPRDKTQNAQHSYTVYIDGPSDSANSTNYDGKPNNVDTIARDPMSGYCMSGYDGSSTSLRDCQNQFAKEVKMCDTYQTKLVNIISKTCDGWNSQRTFSIFFDMNGTPYCRLGNDGEIKKLNDSITIRLERRGQPSIICISKGGVIDSLANYEGWIKQMNDKTMTRDQVQENIASYAKNNTPCNNL